ncbi:hypothetical protein Peur_033491 [Populus x canadensis]
MGCVVAVMADGFNGVGVLSLFWAMVMSAVVFGQGGYGGPWLRMDVECWAVFLDSGRVARCSILRTVVISLVAEIGRWLMVVRQWLCVVASGRGLAGAGVVIGLLVVGSVKGRLVVAGWCGEED